MIAPFEQQFTSCRVGKMLCYGRITMTDFNHIHLHEAGQWVCRRTFAWEDKELIRCEARDEEAEEACHQCAEQ